MDKFKLFFTVIFSVVCLAFYGVATVEGASTVEFHGTEKLSNEISSWKNLNSEGDEENKVKIVNTADLVEKVISSIVSLKVVKARQNYDYNYFTYSDQPEDISEGSGFVIGDDGTILTSSHLVEYAEKITVKLGGKEMDAELVGQDRLIDIAVLRINVSKKLKSFLNLRPFVNGRVGDQVFVIGNPWGLGISVSSGIISAVNRAVEDSTFGYSYMQVDAAMNSGNSGGPVFNAYGEVIGMSTFIKSRVGESNGLGFVLPIDEHVISTVEKLVKFGYKQNGYLGLSANNLDGRNSDYLKIFNVKKKSAVLVVYVVEDSPAENGGILPGDIVVSYDGTRVDDAKALGNMIINTSVGSKVEVVVFRNEKYLKLKVQVGENPSDKKYLDLNQRIADNSIEMLGMFMSQVDDDLIEKYELYSRQRGMYVLDVKKGGWADVNGIEKGDTLITVNQTQITNKKDLLQVFDNMKLNSQKDFIMFFKKQRYKDAIVRRADLSCINY
ncbi:MAG: PDZ domain-containing protein [Rickettsiales bacterium]|jgi:serine protease Do|nr:PDZ domain-containing protein [Rickettsiales bacterium]